MEAIRAETEQTVRLNPDEPAAVFRRSKDLWGRLVELGDSRDKGHLPDWAYSSISEIRAALGEELERVFATLPERLVLRIGVPELDRPGELRITFEQPGHWHAEALNEGVRTGDILLDLTESTSTLNAGGLSKAKQGLERIKAIHI